MKHYIITRTESISTEKCIFWSNIFDYVTEKSVHSEEINLDAFIMIEKEFLKVVSNFIDSFNIENLYYEENEINLNYEYEIKSFKERIKWAETNGKEKNETLEDHERYINFSKNRIKIIKNTNSISLRGMQNIINKSYKNNPDNFKDKIFINSKEEAMSNMNLTFRNLYNTAISDTQTKASLDTGNSGLFLMVSIPNDMSIKILFKDVYGLKYRRS